MCNGGPGPLVSVGTHRLKLRLGTRSRWTTPRGARDHDRGSWRRDAVTSSQQVKEPLTVCPSRSVPLKVPLLWLAATVPLLVVA